jgi:GT2 family glycosyltransferase
MTSHDGLRFGAVAIGRNEGARLAMCLSSLTAAAAVIYVDSGSTDGSIELAAKHDADVVKLDMSIPFTAARARNAGLARLGAIAPDVAYVQFIDGDCELIRGWAERALAFLSDHPDVGAVSGKLLERYPERSVYNWLCDLEWKGPVGEASECGGIAMIRIEAFAAVRGFREDLIAGEEPELCVRLRRAGWRIWRLDVDMALHDAAMTRFAQWWKRMMRGGHAFAEGAYLHGSAPERFRVWESRRALLSGVALPLACLLAIWLLWPWGLAALLIFPLDMVRQFVRNQGPFGQRATLAVFQTLARFPEAMGELTFLGNRLLRRQARLIEYK